MGLLTYEETNINQINYIKLDLREKNIGTK